MASVNRPTVTATRDQDINQKLQLYGIFQAFSNGKVPSNKQIDIALNSFLASKPMANPSSKLSEEGRHLVADLKEVIRQAKYLLLTKNEGNLLQDFIWQTQNLDGGNAGVPGAPVDKDTAKQHGNQALEGLRTLGTLIISNGQFRKLLKDAQVLLRDIAGDAAQKTANKVNPSEDDLQQIDEPAEDNTWHDVPDMSRDNIRNQVKSRYDKQKPLSRGDLQDATQSAQDTGMDHARNAPTSDDTTPGDLDGPAGAQAGARAGLDHLKGRASDNIPDETKDRARETKENAKGRSKDYLRNKMPQERRDQTIWRLRKMVVEIQGHEDYQQAIETLLSLAETYGGHASTVAGDSKGTVKGARQGDSNLQIAEADLKTLIERFANSTSTDDLFEAINNIYRDADRDPELKNWFKAIDRYARRCLQEQGYILRDESTEEWNRLYDRGQFLLRDRYRDHTDRILDEFNFIGNQFDQDPHNRAFSMAIQKLFQDLGNDENGKATFKPHLIKDLTNVVIPGIFENTRYIPIPRIEASDPMIDAIVENLVIESDNLFPNVVEFGNDNYFRLGRRQVSSTNQHKVMIAASGIQMDLKDVAYYVKKKQGFPSLTDKGVMDVFLGGEGFSFKLAARTAEGKDRTHFVAVDTVHVNVKNLNIKLKQSNHKLLFNLAKPLLLKVMKPVITKIIEKQIRDNFEKLDALAWDLYQDVQKAAKQAQNDPENAQGIFSQYLQAYQRKLTAQKNKAQEKASKTTVNMAITKQDSVFKNISLPGGISTKATEFKELAAKGDKWESPVFGIGSARESTDIPKLTPISRKQHNTASGAVRGGNHPTSGQNVGSGYDPTMSSAGPDHNQGYGHNTGSGYGQNTTSTGVSGSNQGYGQNTGAGYNQSMGSAGYNTSTNPTSGFSNQVDQAFDNKANTSAQPATNGVPTTGGTSYYENVTAR